MLRCPAVPRGARQSGWRVSVEKGPGADPDGVLGHAEEGLHPEVTGGHTHRWVSVLANLQREPGPWLGHVCWVCVLSDTLRVSEPAARARSVSHEMKVPSGSGSARAWGWEFPSSCRLDRVGEGVAFPAGSLQLTRCQVKARLFPVCPSLSSIGECLLPDPRPLLKDWDLGKHQLRIYSLHISLRTGHLPARAGSGAVESQSAASDLTAQGQPAPSGRAADVARPFPGASPWEAGLGCVSLDVENDVADGQPSSVLDSVAARGRRACCRTALL